MLGLVVAFADCRVITPRQLYKQASENAASRAAL